MGPAYPHVGEEVAVAGARVYPNDKDSTISIYCGYGYRTVKGRDPDGTTVETHGKAIGSRKGKGGLTYTVDPDKGTSGVNGTAGGGPLSVRGLVSIVKHKKIDNASARPPGDGV